MPEWQDIRVRHNGAGESTSRFQIVEDDSSTPVLGTLKGPDVLRIKHWQDVAGNVVYALLDRSIVDACVDFVSDRSVVLASTGYAHIVLGVLLRVSVDLDVCLAGLPQCRGHHEDHVVAPLGDKGQRVR